MKEKPFGWEIEVVTCPFMVHVPENERIVRRHNLGTYPAKSKARLTANFIRIGKLTPLNQKQYFDMYGNPFEHEGRS